MIIKELRQKYGMTQQAFADYLGIPKRTIENWEQGFSEPAEYVVKLIEFRLEHKAD